MAVSSYENFTGVPESFEVSKAPSGSVKGSVKLAGKRMTVWRMTRPKGGGAEVSNPNFDKVQQAFMDSAKVQVRCGVTQGDKTTFYAIYDCEILGVEEDPFARDAAGGGVAGGTMTSASRTPTPAQVAESVPGVRLARNSTSVTESKPAPVDDYLDPTPGDLLRVAATLVARYDENIGSLDEAIVETVRVARRLLDAAFPAVTVTGPVKEWDTGAVA